MDNKKNKFLFVNSSDFLLIRLIAFVGQGIALGVTQYYFEVTEFVTYASWAVAMLLLISVGLAYYLLNRGDKILTERQIFLFLCFDILQISLLIGLNGGYTNPFIFIILAPIAIAASYLTIERVLVILSLSLVCYALIFNFYIDLPLSVRPEININYSLAIMISLFISSIFLVFYLYYFSMNYKSTQTAYELASKQLQNERDFSKLDVAQGGNKASKFRILNPQTIEAAQDIVIEALTESLEREPTLEEIQAAVTKYLLGVVKGFDTGLSGLKDGGRVAKANGGITETADVNMMTKTPTGMTDVNVKETETVPATTNEINISYQQLRDRLPPEVTDDIVLLLSQSYEALADFAEIQTQADVNQFNIKYNVQLFLPQQTGA